MISFRFPWYSMFAGALVVLFVCIAQARSPIGLAALLAGALLLLDGALGVRLLPSLTPHASFPEDWREIERNMYVRRLGVIRVAVAGLACVGLAVGSSVVGTGDWQVWYMTATIVACTIGWLLASLRAIRDALANDI
jgi:hypothetical protein